MAVVFPIGKSALFAAISAALLTACGQAPGQAAPSDGNSASTSTAVPAPGHWRIIPLALAAGALQQCSRDVPPAGEAPLRFFMPKPADIAEFEAKLSDRLTATGYFERETPAVRDNLAANGVIPTETRATFAVTLASGWTREYIGVERDGVQHIYGNYGLISPPIPGRPIVEDAVIACDGGPSFFGADYDLDNRTITHLAFNGPA